MVPNGYVPPDDTTDSWNEHRSKTPLSKSSPGPLPSLSPALERLHVEQEEQEKTLTGGQPGVVPTSAPVGPDLTSESQGLFALPSDTPEVIEIDPSTGRPRSSGRRGR